jgi:8-oxo-dGTP pyrophosphatase MutT (NUDIX family)
LLRPATDGFEVLLVRRAAELSFHGGAWVFPGGRIDPHELVERPEEAEAARVCAVREVAEEAGLTLSESELRPLSCWTTPEEMPRRFRAWFFMAEAPHGCDVHVDGGEIQAHEWTTPKSALASQGRGEIELPPAVFTTLTLLAARSSHADALSLASGPITTYEPRSVFVPEGRVALYQRDAGYETRSLDAQGPRDRLWALRTGYRYERSG